VGLLIRAAQQAGWTALRGLSALPNAVAHDGTLLIRAFSHDVQKSHSSPLPQNEIKNKKGKMKNWAEV